MERVKDYRDNWATPSVELIEATKDPYKLPDNAIFPVPKVCSAWWTTKDWYDYWIMNGKKTK